MMNSLLPLQSQLSLEENHKNKSQLKKLMPKRRSNEDKYSEGPDKEPLASESSQLEWNLLDFAECRKAGQIKRRNKVKIFLHIHFCLLVMLSSLSSVEACSGRFVNPMTDICWSCLFPISIGPVKVSGGGREDTENPHLIPCVCSRAPYFGIPLGFWEPARLVDRKSVV